MTTQEFINLHKGQEKESIINELAHVEQAEITAIADALGCKYRTPQIIAETLSAMKSDDEQTTEQEETPKTDKEESKPSEPTIHSCEPKEGNSLFCICVLPTDVKVAIQKEMERRAEGNEELKAHLAEVSYTDVFDKIEQELVKLAKNATKHNVGGMQMAGLHYSDEDTYNLAQFLILNQPTQAEKEEAERKRKEEQEKKDKAKSSKEKKSADKGKEKGKVTPFVPNTNTNSAKAEIPKKEDKKPTATQLSLF